MNANCPCKKENCSRHGDCEACKAYHAVSKYNRLTACRRPENISSAPACEAEKK